jgi:hypothetical protein
MAKGVIEICQEAINELPALNQIQRRAVLRRCNYFLVHHGDFQWVGRPVNRTKALCILNAALTKERLRTGFPNRYGITTEQLRDAVQCGRTTLQENSENRDSVLMTMED